MSRKIYFFLILLFASKIGFGQNGKALFNQDTLHEIRFSFDQPDFWDLMTNYYLSSVNHNTGAAENTPYLSGTFSFDGEVIESVGLRQKGFSSYFASTELKKSLKVDLNEFVLGQNIDGIKKFNLSNGVGDPGMQRDVICYDLMRKAGIRAPRTSYAKVYLNDEYWGIYVIIEQIDKTFLEANFADSNGNLYKNVGWSDLEYMGDSSIDYAGSIALRTNEENPDWSDYTEFVKIINQTPQSLFKEEIEKVFNVDYYLRVLVVDVMTNNWDSYIEHGRNFYLYHEPSSDQFFWIPWDYNLAMGGNFTNIIPGTSEDIEDPAECPTVLSGDVPHSPEDSIFVAVVNFQSFCCYEVWDGFCDDVYDHLANLGNCNSITSGSSPYPPSDPIFQRVTFVESMCCDGEWDENCQAMYDDIVEFENGEIEFSYDFPLNMSDSEKVLIKKILLVPEYRERYYNYACNILDDNFEVNRLSELVVKNAALISESFEMDENSNFPYGDFLWDLGDGGDSSNRLIPPVKQFVRDRVLEMEEDLMETGHSCSSSLAPINWNDVVFNEFVASNDSISNIFDQDGEADDWIELFNNTDLDVDLTDFFLSDNYGNPLKWAFPAGANIEANGYLIVWADENGMEEGLHANFKLAKAGESIMLVHSDGTFIDSLSYGPQETNIPSARIPNGTGDFQSHYPTFNRNNEGPSAVGELEGISFKVFPNPASELLNVTFGSTVDVDKINIFMTTTLGQIVFRTEDQIENQVQINVAELNTGMYFLIVEKGRSRVVQKLIIE